MKKFRALIFVMILASFTLFAEDQRKGFVTNVLTDSGFGSFIGSMEVTYHPFGKNGVPVTIGKDNANYRLGLENSLKEKIIEVKTKADSYVFDPDEIIFKSMHRYNVLNPCGYGSGNYYFDRAALLFALRYFYDGMTFQDLSSETDIGILADQNFFPNGDKRYANRLIVTTIAKEVVAELTIDQILELPAEKNKKKDDEELPLAKRTVEEVYNLISMEHEGKGFDFLLYPNDIESVVDGSTIQEKTIEAKRQKLVSYVKWTFTLPRTIEALKILSFVLEYEDFPDMSPILVVNFAREIAEWRLMNPKGAWQEYLLKSMSSKTLNNTVSPTNWLDVYLGIRGVAYNSSGSNNADVMGKFGLGYNIGESFVYFTGYVGMPVQISLSSLQYEAALNTNIRFLSFFELNTDAYYYNTGRLRFTLKPNFIIFSDILQIGAGVDFDVLPSSSITFFTEVFVKDIVGVGAGYTIGSRQANISAKIKL